MWDARQSTWGNAEEGEQDCESYPFVFACMWWFLGVSEQDIWLHLLCLFMLTLCARLTSYHLKNKWHPFCSNLAALMNLRAFIDHCFSWNPDNYKWSLAPFFFIHTFSLNFGPQATAYKWVSDDSCCFLEYVLYFGLCNQSCQKYRAFAMKFFVQCYP